MVRVLGYAVLVLYCVIGLAAFGATSHARALLKPLRYSLLCRANEWRRLIDSICDQESCIDAAVHVKAASLNQPPPVKSSRG
jgi:hypothetical protein